MANSVDRDNTAQKAWEKEYTMISCWEWQIVQTLVRLQRMSNGVDTDQTAENCK